jgi:hypothetical protein
MKPRPAITEGRPEGSLTGVLSRVHREAAQDEEEPKTDEQQPRRQRGRIPGFARANTSPDAWVLSCGS